MRNIRLITQLGLTTEFNFEPTDPWGGFDYIQEKAAELMRQDRESDWVMVEEGQGSNKYEQTIFRGWFESRGLLDASLDSNK